MTMIDARMSPRVEAGFSVVVGSSTRITTKRNGHERRNSNWAQKKRRYTSRYASWTRAMRQDLMDQVMVADGRTYSFPFKDWNDYSVTGQALGTAPAASTPVQLVKTYTKGSTTRTRTITKPVAATVVVYEDAGSGPVAKAGTVSATTGLFTPDTAWTVGAALSWSGEFDVCVRFATDEPEFVLPHRDICEVVCELIEVFGE